eukprot:735048_1
MSSTQATFVCKECKEIVHYDFNQKLNEDEWKSLQDLGSTTNTVVTDPEKILEQSFVFINKNWEKLQNYQLHHSMDHSHKRRTNNNNNNNNNNIDNKIDETKSTDKTNNTNNKSINANDFAHSLNVLEQILQITAGHAKADHPLCSDCTDKIMKGLDSQIDELKLEKKTLTAFILQWENEQKKLKESVRKKKTNDNNRNRSTNNYDIDEETRFKQYQSEANLLEKN